MILELKNCCFGYKNQEALLKDISFGIEKGDVLTILGPNGVGKTTLLKCILGIYRWNSGTTLFNGKEFNSIVELPIGYVPQAHAPTFAYTVMDFVLMGRCKYIGALSTPSHMDKNIAKKVLKDIGIFHLAEKQCNELSGGQLQLVYIARALVSNPEVLVLDEPENCLDFRNQYLLFQLLERLVEELSLTCIINTHYPENALRYGTKAFMINREGYIFGATEQILNTASIQKIFGVNSIIGHNAKDDKNIPYFSVIDAL